MEAGRKPLSGNGLTLYLRVDGGFLCADGHRDLVPESRALRASRTIHENYRGPCCATPSRGSTRRRWAAQNRFATDIQAVDRSVAMTTMFLIRSLVAPCVSLVRHRPPSSVVITVLHPRVAVAFNVARNYLLLARDLKRIDSTTKSPVYALFNESLNGLQTLRSFDGAFFALRAALRWIG